MTSFPVSIGKFIVLQLTEEAAKDLKSAIDNGDMVDFGEVGDDDVKIVAEFDGVGQGEVV